MTSTFLFYSRLTRLVVERFVVMVGGWLEGGGGTVLSDLPCFYSGDEVLKKYDLCACYRQALKCYLFDLYYRRLTVDFTVPSLRTC